MAIDPAFVAAIGSLVDRYGLPLAFLVGLGWALFTRRIVLGSELERTVTGYQTELAYREERRIEERASRLTAETTMREFSGALTKLAAVQEQTADTILDRIDGKDERRVPPRR